MFNPCLTYPLDPPGMRKAHARRANASRLTPHSSTGGTPTQKWHMRETLPQRWSHRLHRQLIYPLGSVPPRSFPQGEPIYNWLRLCRLSPVMDILHGSSPLPLCLIILSQISTFLFRKNPDIKQDKSCVVVFMSQYLMRASRQRYLASPCQRRGVLNLLSYRYQVRYTLSDDSHYQHHNHFLRC